MKKLKFIFTMLLLLGLVVGAYALGGGASVTKTDCCCKDSCPMKSKDKTAKSDKDSCCCGENCCCKDGACPMRSKNSADSAKKENASGCCSCCGDSCPMKSKEKKTSTATVVAAAPAAQIPAQ